MKEEVRYFHIFFITYEPTKSKRQKTWNQFQTLS